MKAWRAALLGFDASRQPWRIDDGMLVVQHGRILALGPYAELAARHRGLEVVDWRGLTLAPGFIDPHVHFPQIDLIGSPAPGLLPWLQRYTFPLEARFADPAVAADAAGFFVDELLRNGVTTAMAWGSSHPVSVDALLREAQARRLRMIAGKCLMDREVPEAVRDHSQRGLEDTDALIRRWHDVDRLGIAITPRFVPSCSASQLGGAAELARAHPDVWVQTHAAENREELALVRRLHPQARSYLDVYDAVGLLRPRSVLAHCIHIDDQDRRRLAQTGAAVAVCPSSNLFLGSGVFDFDAARRSGFAWALASDVGAGTSLSPFHTMLDAWKLARLGAGAMEAAELWWRHTAGAARAIDLGGLIGNLAPGLEADFIALDDRATPLLARRTEAAASLDEWLAAMIVLADDRAIRHTVVLGEVARLRCAG